MRRWNGWGDDTVEFNLADSALSFLAERLGQGIEPVDATLEQACNTVPPSRLTSHPLLDITARTRLLHGFGQSMPDWLRLRYGRIGPVPDAIAFPETSAQVRDLLDFARVNGASVIPYGGGTSVVGHLTAPAGPQPVLTINLSRLSRLINLDRETQLATFGAGVAGPDLEAQLRARGYSLGHFPQSFEYSTLGGWVVTRSSGQQSLRYGRIEQLFAGGRLEAPTGTLNIPCFPASAAGLDLREIVLGSEGRMGILTEATVRVTPLPAAEEFHAVFFPDWAHAETAVREISQARLQLSMLRLSNPIETLTTLMLAGSLPGHQRAIGWLRRYIGWRGCRDNACLLLIGASGSRETVEHALRASLGLARAQKGLHIGQSIGKKWKQNRFRNVYLRNSLWQHGYAVDTAETAVNWNKVVDMMHAVEDTSRSALAKDGERIHTYAHLSHFYPQGASVYTTFIYRLAGDYQRDMLRWSGLKQAVSQAIAAQGGTISHQHGVGLDHAPYLASEKGELGMRAMRALFQPFDPDGIMNPGKLLT